jgi:hypothetical protein
VNEFMLSMDSMDDEIWQHSWVELRFRIVVERREESGLRNLQ